MFNERLKEIRIESKLTQQALAEAMGVTVRCYQYYEEGKKNPSLEKAVLLADVLDVSLDHLFGRCNDPENHKKS